MNLFFRRLRLWVVVCGSFVVLSSCSVVYRHPSPPATLFDPEVYPLKPINTALNVAVIGDVPYSLFPDRAFHRLQKAINDDASLRWVLHAGDIKSGAVPCWKWLYRSRKQLFDRFQTPWVLTLGDNEWTDCHRWLSGGFSPLSRLAYARDVFFGQEMMPRLTDFQGQSQALNSTDYSEFKEHLRWVDNGVMFVSIHTVGSNNAEEPFKGRTQADNDEVVQRNAAIKAWLDDAYRFLQHSKQNIHAVVILSHANANFESATKVGGEWRFPLPKSSVTAQQKAASQAFAPLLSALEHFVIRADRPVLLIQGDGHQFRFDQPWKTLGREFSQFWRLQTFGVNTNVWIKLQVSPSFTKPFVVQPQKVSEKKGDRTSA